MKIRYKAVIATALAAVLLVTLLAGCATVEFTEDGYTHPMHLEYKIEGTGENRTVTITGFKYKWRWSVLRIPPFIEGLPVTAITEEAFGIDLNRWSSNAQREFLARFEGGGFYKYTKLTELTIPASVRTIGRGAFSENALSSVIIPEGVTSIGDVAFQNNQLTSVIIPGSVTSIGRGAFRDNRLTSVTIPEGVTSIEWGAFSENALTSVIIPEGVTSIDGGAFSVNALTSVIIPEGVTSIGDAVFQGNQLTSVIIPDSVTSIGRGAFRDNRLTDVVIPGSITSIEQEAFCGNQLTSVIIPGSVTSIGNAAFQDNQLTSVTIPEGVTSIGNTAFLNNKLTSVIIPGSVKTIGFRAFENNQLTNVTLSEGITSMGYYAFLNNQLTSVTIPEGVKSIGDRAFAKNRIATVIISGSSQNLNLTLHSTVFGDNQVTHITLPGNSLKNGIAHMVGESRAQYVSSLTVTDGRIDDNAYSGMNLTSVTIQEGVTFIGNGAFFGNPLTRITIPASLTRFTQAFDPNQPGGFFTTYGKGSGTYELKNGIWHHNGIALRPGPALLVLGDGIYIAKIDGVSPGRRSSAQDKQDTIVVPEGFHRIEVFYYKAETNSRSRTSTYSEGTVTFEHALTLEGGAYDLTGTVQGKEILFRIRKRN